jgi:multiple sugar transport system ATP-binding protein
VRVGERLGLRFRPEKLSLFDKTTSRALRSALHDGAAHV